MLHGSHIACINRLVPSDDYSLKYSTVNHAISLVKIAGRGAWLLKCLPIHPDFRCLFGVKWRDVYYFAVRLTFGCKSSPKLFESLSEALC